MCDFLEYSGADYRLLPPNGGADDLKMQWERMKAAGSKRSLPTKSKGPIRAQLHQPEGRGRDLGWTGGKAGS
jgi:hypothetical protein